MFRLTQKHSKNLDRHVAPVDPKMLLAAQSVRAAVTGAAIAIICLNIVWVYTASASGRFFPWISVWQGIAIGLSVQRTGRGLDWRFPLIAGIAAWIGAFSGNLFIALAFTTTDTGREIDGWWQILQSFFMHTTTVVDLIYAFCAVAVATFYSKRRLNRHEVLALRKNKEAQK